jgi:calcineurin-like phosphoesterase family protein
LELKPPKEVQAMAVWFTSDQHFYHANVIRYCDRPFESVEQMNEEIVRRFNESVQSGDLVYHLGDFSLAKRPVELFLPRLNGEHHLIAGNHDHVHPVHHKGKEGKRQNAYKLYYDSGFKTIQLELKIRIGGRSVLLHHMPFQGDHEVERFTAFRPTDRGDWLLHGHIHEKWRQRGRMINVGVDAWDYRPVSIEQITQLIEDGPNDLDRISAT